MGSYAAFVAGGIGIGGTRHGNLTIDCFFRCIFAAGFIAILHYLAVASDNAFLEGMK